MQFGFQDDGRLRNGDYRSLSQGRGMGARALRLIVSRDQLKRTPGGGYDFSAYDNIVNHARKHGLKPQIVLDNRSGSGMGNPGQYAKFVALAGRHFKGRVHRYSLINEPDMKMAPEKYRQLYVRGQKALGRADRKAEVLFGEFSPHNPVGYAKKVLGKHRPALHASGFAWHPYQRTDPLAPSPYELAHGVKGGIGRLGTLQKQIGRLNIKTRAGKTPGAYLTELGWGSKGYTADTSQYAARYWPRAVQKARNAGARQLIAYTMTANDSPTWDTGLLNPDGTPRPAYHAVAAAVRASQPRARKR